MIELTYQLRKTVSDQAVEEYKIELTLEQTEAVWARTQLDVLFLYFDTHYY